MTYGVPETAADMRSQMKGFEKQLRGFVDFVKTAEGLGDKGECIAQAMLALRAFEDSRMRMGKVIQYAGDGESCFDKPMADAINAPQ